MSPKLWCNVSNDNSGSGPSPLTSCAVIGLFTTVYEIRSSFLVSAFFVKSLQAKFVVINRYNIILTIFIFCFYKFINYSKSPLPTFFIFPDFLYSDITLSKMPFMKLLLLLVL